MSRYAEKILEIVWRSHEHMTAEQIYLEMKKLYPRIVLATVYNNLNILTADGKIRRVSVEGSPDRYDRTTRHDHLVCQKCGELADVTLQDLTQTLERQVGEVVLSYDLKINYICPKCRQREESE